MARQPPLWSTCPLRVSAYGTTSPCSLGRTGVVARATMTPLTSPSSATTSPDGCREPALRPDEGGLRLVQGEASLARAHVAIGHARAGGEVAAAGSNSRRTRGERPVGVDRFALFGGSTRGASCASGGSFPRDVGGSGSGCRPGVGLSPAVDPQRPRDLLGRQSAPNLDPKTERGMAGQPGGGNE